jgi:tetratricopeptide repeat protein
LSWIISEAEPLLKRALDIRLSVLGEVHPDVANSFNNLGAHYLDSKAWQQAYDAFARASAILISRSAKESNEGQTTGDLKVHDTTNPFPGTIVAAYQGSGPQRTQGDSTPRKTRGKPESHLRPFRRFWSPG